MKIFLTFLLVFSNTYVLFAQEGDVEVSVKKSIMDLPVGTVMTIDGKSLSKLQKECPDKVKKKMLIKGQETEVESSNLLFQDGEVKCYGGVGLKLIVTDLSGQYVSLKGKVPAKAVLQCKVKEVSEVQDDIGIQLGSPCNFSVFYNKGAFSFKESKNLSIESFQENLGEHIKFSLDYQNNFPKGLNTDESVKEVNPANQKQNSSNNQNHAISE